MSTTTESVRTEPEPAITGESTAVHRYARARMPPPTARSSIAFTLAALTIAAGGLGACGRDRSDSGGALVGGKPAQNAPDGGAQVVVRPEQQVLLTTKNTQRIPLSDPVALAAAVARAVYPGDQQPATVALADSDDWRAALAGAVLMAPPLRAPLLLTSEGEIPASTSNALKALKPAGAPRAGNAQVIRLGTAGDPPGLRAAAIAGADPFTLAANVAEYRARVAGRYSASVVVVAADDPAYAMPAAAWAAKSGDPILFTERLSLPPATSKALRAHGRPRIYLLGPRKSVSRAVETALGKLGTVTRITGGSPQTTAIAFARFVDAGFGWGIVDPGHGMVIANPDRPIDAGAAAPLSASGSYGPLLLVADGGELPTPLRDYLEDIRPGYSSDPVRGVYNRAWIVGSTAAVSEKAQALTDGLLEIVPAAIPSETP